LPSANYHLRLRKRYCRNSKGALSAGLCPSSLSIKGDRTTFSSLTARPKTKKDTRKIFPFIFTRDTAETPKEPSRQDFAHQVCPSKATELRSHLLRHRLKQKRIHEKFFLLYLREILPYPKGTLAGLCPSRLSIKGDRTTFSSLTARPKTKKARKISLLLFVGAP